MSGSFSEGSSDMLKVPDTQSFSMGAAGSDEFEEVLERLSPELREEVEDFARFLLERHRRAASEDGEMPFSWQGALQHLRDDYTSKELQEKVTEWWGA